MQPIPITRTIAEPDLENCPMGFLFRGRDPDWSKEERCFVHMEAPLNHRHWSPETYLFLIEDQEGRALENVAKSETLIITRDRHLADCRVEARVRQFIPGALPNMDDEYCTVARNGVIFRMQDLRRYYQFCLEGYDRVALYRRRDYDREVLGERRFPLDPRRYHHLVAQVQGDRICCWCDGELVADARDTAYAEGAAGIRMNSICRFQGIRVGTWEEGHAGYVSRMEQREKQLREMRETIPRPALWRKLSLPRLQGGRPHFFRPQEGGPVRLLVANGGEFKGHSLYDLEGKLLWETPAQGEGPGEFKFADMDGDGIKEIVTKKGDRMGFLTLQDLSGSCEIVVFPDLYKANPTLLRRDATIFIRGKINSRDDIPKVIAEEIVPLDEVKKRFTRLISIDLHTAGLDPDLLQKLKDILASHRGKVPVYLSFRDPSGKTAVIQPGDTYRVETTDELFQAIESLLGENAVKIR